MIDSVVGLLVSSWTLEAFRNTYWTTDNSASSPVLPTSGRHHDSSHTQMSMP